MLRVIAGRAKSGKSELAVKEYTEYINSDFKTSEAYYIVPEQYTVEVERRILSSASMDNRALFGDEVLSFKRLVHRILGRFGGVSGDVLSQSGKIMLLAKAAYLCKSQLSYYKDIDSNPGRAEQILKQIEEFGKNLVRPEALENVLNSGTESETLRMKLSDLLIIYKKYIEELSRIGVTEESLYEKAGELADKNGFFRDKRIWIDEFTGFTPIERLLIRSMIKSCDEVTVCLCFDEDKDPLFDCIRDTYNSLIRMCDDISAAYAPVIFAGEGDYSYRQKFLGEIEKYFTSAKSHEKLNYKETEFSGILEIHKSDNIFTEIQYAARKVKELYSSGYTYSDIALACRNIGEYGSLTEAVFSLEGIPFFRDTRKSVISHPIIRAVNAAFAVISDDFRQKDIISFLKTGLFIQDSDIVDRIENYILASRLSGERRWKKETEPVCASFYAVFSSFMADIKTKNNISGVVTSLKKFIEDSGIERNVSDAVDNYLKNNMTEAAEEYRLVWNNYLEILNQAEVFLGDWTSDSFDSLCKMFSEISSAALSETTIGFLPQKQNAVKLYDISRSCIGSVRALIVMGANEGVMPASVSDDGILSDGDRDFIKGFNIELADDTDTVIEKEMFRVYSTLFAPSDFLLVSYPLVTASGESAIPSGFAVNKLVGLFEKDTFYMTEDAQPKHDSAEMFKDETLCPDISEKLFLSGDSALLSVSQIEKYINCPYSYFLSYGLRVRERFEGDWKDSDIGTLMHILIEKGLKTVEQSDYTNLTDSEIRRECIRIADEIQRDNLSSLPGVFVEDEKRSVLVSRLSGFAGHCIYSIYRQFSSDGFVPKAYEVEFGPGRVLPSVDIAVRGDDGTIVKTVRLNGKIDRFDAMIDRNNGKVYVRVIDYKSGNETVNMDEIRAGLKLQLAVYLDALTNGSERKRITGRLSDAEDFEVIPGGAFYYVMDDDIISAKSRTEALREDTENGKKFEKMQGVMIEDPLVLDALRPETRFGSNSQTPAVNLVFSYDESGQLFESVEGGIAESVYRILAGRIPSKALVKNNKKSPCDYCKFACICGRKGNSDGKL